MFWKKRYAIDASVISSHLTSLEDEDAERLSWDEAAHQALISIAEGLGDVSKQAEYQAAYEAWKIEHARELRSKAYRDYENEQKAYWASEEGQRYLRDMKACLEEAASYPPHYFPRGGGE